MKTLSAGLLEAQKQAVRSPSVRVEASNRSGDVVNLKWQRLYTGQEPDSFHALNIASDGAMIRLRVGLPGDNRRLYLQRVVIPGAGADFSQWSYTGYYGVSCATVCSFGQIISVFFADLNSEVFHLKSIDSGLTWLPEESIGSTSLGYVSGISAAYKSNGDLALFVADFTDLFVFRLIDGQWQTRVNWNKTTGCLSGVSTVYNGDWNLLVSGREDGGDHSVWSLVYGDGGDIAPGNWSALKTIAAAPSNSGFEFAGVYLTRPDTYRCFYSERFTGIQSYNRVFCSNALPGVPFLDSLWREPVPFNYESAYGLAAAKKQGTLYLSSPAGVWQAGLFGELIDLSPDIVGLEANLERNSGQLIVALSNEKGQYARPGSGDLTILEPGCRISFSVGYRTPSGDEFCPESSFILESYEHACESGRSILKLHALDGWSTLEKWKARVQMRWNKGVQESNVKDILLTVLARSGIRLEVISFSTVAAGYFPDFTIHAGDNGKDIVVRLLAFVPDVILIDGSVAYLINPLSSDTVSFSYSTAACSQELSSLPIREGNYAVSAWKYNRMHVEGLDPVSSQTIAAEVYSWEEVEKVRDRLMIIEDLNLDSASRAQERGEAYLRRFEIESGGGFISGPVNCGQQIYDVIEITDSRAGLEKIRRRVLGLTLSYRPARNLYEHKTYLGMP